MDREELFSRNIRIAYKLWHRWRRFWPRDEQEDLLQEILLALWDACRRYDPERGAFSTIAYLKVTHSVSKMLGLKRRRESIHTEPLMRTLPSGDEEDHIAAPESVHDVVAARMALRALPGEALAFLAGLRRVDIAQRAGLSQAQVSRRIKRARKVVETFTDMGVDGRGTPKRCKNRDRSGALVTPA